MFESSLSLSDTNHVLALFGSRDQNIRMIRDKLGVDVLHQDGKGRVTGEEWHSSSDSVPQCVTGYLISPDAAGRILSRDA